MGEQNDGPFYAFGLRFSCTRCSLCCRFDSGYVWLSRADLARLAAGLDLPENTVVERYCRIVNIGGFKQLSLREQENMDCVFWVDGACSVYGLGRCSVAVFPSGRTSSLIGKRGIDPRTIARG